MTVVWNPFYSQLRFVMCRRYFLMNKCWYRFTYAVYVYVMCDKGRSRLFYWCSFLKYWHCRSRGQLHVKTEKFVSISSFLNQRRSIRIEEPYATFIYIAILQAYIYCIIMSCVLANSLTLSLLPGFDKESVTLYIVYIHEKQGQVLRFWILCFYSLRTEEKIDCRGIKKQRKKIKCYVRLSLLQMFML